MGKTSKWLRSFLTGKKDHKEKEKGTDQTESGPITPATPKEKRRWSFRRSSATAPATSSPRDSAVEAKPPLPQLQPLPQPQTQPQVVVAEVESEDEEEIYALTMAEATAAAADAAAAAAQAAAAVVRMTAVVEEAAAMKIQAYFRSYLARKALRALKGLVKLQALVRGHLVRKQATATLRCMQALITLQAKAREQRIRMIEETKPSIPRSSTHRKSSEETRIKNIYHENDRALEENIKIVEMDIQSRQYSNNSSRNYSSKHDQTFHQYSPAPSAITEMSPRAYSGHFEDYNSFTTAQSSPQCFRFKEYYNADSLSSYDYPLFPNYMSNTESSRAKARSQSAPKQRPPELYERQPSGRRRASMEGTRNGVPRAVRMQRSSSHVGSTAAAKEYANQQQPQPQYNPWMAIKLDRSNISLKDSECGSTSTVMTSANYCRSIVAGDVHGNKY